MLYLLLVKTLSHLELVKKILLLLLQFILVPITMKPLSLAMLFCLDLLFLKKMALLLTDHSWLSHFVQPFRPRWDCLPTDSLQSLLCGLNGKIEGSAKFDLSKLWDEISVKDDSPLCNIRFEDTLKQSIQLDSTKWSHLPFVERKALHFEPLNPAK